MGFNAQRAAARKKRPQRKPAAAAATPSTTPLQLPTANPPSSAGGDRIYARPLAELLGHLASIQALGLGETLETADEAMSILPHLQAASGCLLTIREVTSGVELPAKEAESIETMERMVCKLFVHARRAVEEQKAEGSAAAAGGAGEDEQVAE
ncbi:hypothetical protein H9P43_006787 [Blastocladiella emersonii ATCC 22665]|nr:hypothetical protein H9P43_006787 [Blastocladiella emersonii ATCC 22665]